MIFFWVSLTSWNSVFIGKDAAGACSYAGTIHEDPLLWPIPMTVERRVSIRTVTALLIGAALTVRILVAFVFPLPWFSADSYGYISQAHDLLAGKWIPFFPVGYPVIIAAITAIVPSASSPSR